MFNIFPSTSIEGMTDSYKYVHWMGYLDNLRRMYSYFESRDGALFNQTVFAGLQYYLKRYFCGPVVTLDGIKRKKELAKNHFGYAQYFNEEMWMYILRKYEGRLPLRIRAVLEGTPVDVSNVLMTIENTDDNCSALTNHCETALSNIWAPCTVASLSREVKIMCRYYAQMTCDDANHLMFQLHDFGQRGVTSPESAGIEGMAHIINFMGTDTTLAMDCAHDFYNSSYEALAYSVFATEHSMMTSLGPSGEKKIFRRVLEKAPNDAIVSIVDDSFDCRRFISEYAFQLRDMILGRLGKCVFRPDSGEPVTTTLDQLERLDQVFGSFINKRGYRVLNPKVGLLWGDGIDYQGIRNILHAMRTKGWASSNIVFGMGGGLLQKINRDTQRFAFKCCAQEQGDEWIDIYKDPIDSSKKSKRGRLKLTLDQNFKYHTVAHDAPGDDQLVTIFENGELLVDQSFSDIRKRAELV